MNGISSSAMPIPSSDMRITTLSSCRSMATAIVAFSPEYLHAFDMILLMTDSIFTTSISIYSVSTPAVKRKCFCSYAASNVCTILWQKCTISTCESIISVSVSASMRLVSSTLCISVFIFSAFSYAIFRCFTTAGSFTSDISLPIGPIISDSGVFSSCDTLANSSDFSAICSTVFSFSIRAMRSLFFTRKKLIIHTTSATSSNPYTIIAGIEAYHGGRIFIVIPHSFSVRLPSLPMAFTLTV